MSLLVPSALLFFLGLLVLQSVSPDLFGIQLLFGLIALVVYILVSQIDYQIIFSLHPVFSILSTGLLILTFVIGELTRGTHRWLDFGSFSLQPSEIAKPFILVSFAVILTTVSQNLPKITKILLFSLLPAFLVFFQPDLGSFLVIFSGLLVIQFAKIPFKYVILFILSLSLLSIPSYLWLLKDYQRDRINTFINPYADPLGKGYHVIQSVISVGSGGALGKGLGQGSQSQLRFLPEQHTDFIFASLTEELGLVGGSIVLLLYAVIFYRIYTVSQRTTDPSATLVSLGILRMLFFQVFVNIGMNIGVAPVTGITLPFLSYGGSSLLSLAILLGIVSSISSQNRYNTHSV